MNTCQNCGNAVSDAYVRVFSRNDADAVTACPECPDRVRVDGQVREARSTRSGGGGPARTSPARDAGGEEA